MKPHVLPPVPTLSCEGVTYRVGGPNGKTILQPTTFSAHGGEIIGLCGPNGAGKSTFLKLLGGLIAPTKGSITVNNHLINRYKPRQLALHLSYLPQDTQVPFDFPAREIVLMGRHPYAASLAAWSPEDLAIAEQSMTAAACVELADQSVTTLSGGERQRVMVARLLAQDTPIVLLDEMTANQDIRYANLLLDLASDLAKAGKLVILVLHDLRAAARICNRVCLMHQGQLVADGDPIEVLHEGHIEYVYGVPARTFINPLGSWDYDILRPDPEVNL